MVILVKSSCKLHLNKPVLLFAFSCSLGKARLSSNEAHFAVDVVDLDVVFCVDQ